MYRLVLDDEECLKFEVHPVRGLNCTCVESEAIVWTMAADGILVLWSVCRPWAAAALFSFQRCSLYMEYMQCEFTVHAAQVLPRSFTLASPSCALQFSRPLITTN